MYNVEGYHNILKVSCRPLAFTSFKVFLKNKKRSGTSIPASISERFLKKNISLAIFYQLTKFHCMVAFTSLDIGQYLYCNCFVNQIVTSIIMKLFNQAVSSTWPKSHEQKLKYFQSFKTKSLFFFKGLSLKKIKQFFWNMRVCL